MSIIGATRQRGVSFGAADWLCLAAAPTFAIMALLTGVLGDGPADMICSAAHGGSPLGGMVPMYGLMSAFHAPPWLRLIARRWRAARGFSRPSSGLPVSEPAVPRNAAGSAWGSARYPQPGSWPTRRAAPRLPGSDS